MAHPGHERDLDARTSPSETSHPDSPSEQAPADRGVGTTRRRTRAKRVVAPLAALAVASSAVFGVVSATGDDTEPGAGSGSVALTSAIGEVVDRRVEDVSRSAARNVDDPKTLADNPKKLQAAYDKAARRTATYEAVQSANKKRWTTVDLNLWTLPGNRAKKVGLLSDRKHVRVTGRHRYGRTEIVVQGKSRWVTGGYLAKQKPPKPKPKPKPKPESSPAPQSKPKPEPRATQQSSKPAASASSASGTCSNGSSLSSGVSPNLNAVHQAVCANFPEITSYGDFRGDGEHAQGIALDIMVSGSRGQQVADFVRANAGSLGVNYVIYAQNIWSTARAGEGWRGMSDRGSATANHYDHVHVTVN